MGALAEAHLICARFCNRLYRVVVPRVSHARAYAGTLVWRFGRVLRRGDRYFLRAAPIRPLPRSPEEIASR